MTTNQPLSLFISSKMTELADERFAVKAALKKYDMYGWLWEDDAGPRSASIRHTYLQEVAACDLYIGLFWLGYGPYTIEEFEHARRRNKPCLIYEKYVNVDQRDPQLQTFLDQIQQVNNPDGLTVCRFTTPKQLAKRVPIDVMRLLIREFRKRHLLPLLPLKQELYSVIPVSEADKNIVINTNINTVNVDIYQSNEPLPDKAW